MKTIDNPVVLAKEAASDYQKIYGAELVSVVLYGSGAGKNFNVKNSDINLLIFLKNSLLKEIEKGDKIIKKWSKYRFSQPLFMDREYLDSSLDTFPIEFLNIKLSYLVLFGDDFIKDILIKPEHLRLQIEREIKGKRIHLTQNWLQVKDSDSRLESLLSISMRDFSACFKAMLHLKGVVPEKKEEIFDEIYKSYHLPQNTFKKVYELLKEGKKKEMRAIFYEYSDALKHLANIIDKES